MSNIQNVEEKPILNLNASPFIPNEKFISFDFK